MVAVTKRAPTNKQLWSPTRSQKALWLPRLPGERRCGRRLPQGGAVADAGPSARPSAQSVHCDAAKRCHLPGQRPDRHIIHGRLSMTVPLAHSHLPRQAESRAPQRVVEEPGREK